MDGVWRVDIVSYYKFWTIHGVYYHKCYGDCIYGWLDNRQKDTTFTCQYISDSEWLL